MEPFQQLVATQFLAGPSPTKLYQSPFSVGMNGITVVMGFVLANTTANTMIITLYNVPAGGSAVAGNEIMPAVALPANTAWFEHREEGVFVIPSGGQLWGSANLPSGTTFTLSGREIP